MFLNKTMFKKWIKSAYQHNGLVVGRIYGGLVLSGAGWVTWTQDGYVPNWLKAAIMEHVGELPGAGLVFRAKKDEVSQYEVSDNPYLNLPERWKEAKVPFVVTPIVYDTGWKHYRLFQCRDTGGIVPVPNGGYDIIDVRELETDGRPMGPSARTVRGDILIWKNENSALAVCRDDVSETGLPVLGVLAGLEYEEVPL